MQNKKIIILTKLIDIVSVMLLSTFFFPVLIIISLYVYAVSGDFFFSQERVGRENKLFRLYKIKTLYSSGSIIKGGEMIRKTGLDELPQLWNILRGDMSLIGPRPLLPEYLPLYSLIERSRHEVKPGLSGLAQIRGFNNLPWRHKFKYDVFYVRKKSLSFDIYILLKTVKGFLSGSRSRTELKTIADPFRGS